MCVCFFQTIVSIRGRRKGFLPQSILKNKAKQNKKKDKMASNEDAEIVNAESSESVGQICDNAFAPSLHKKISACQVCVFRLSDEDKQAMEKNGRHLRVNLTRGGCLNCKAFPSQEGEDPVRLCRQCFFDTHKLRPAPEEPFGGSPSFVGLGIGYKR